MVGLASLVLVVQAQRRVHLVLRSTSLQRHAQRPPLDVLRCHLECRQLCLQACHLAHVHLLVARFLHLQGQCLPLVSASRHLLVSAWLLVHRVLVLAVSVQVLVVVLVALVFVLVLVVHALVVLADSVLVLVAHAPAALAALAHVLVLVLVLAVPVALVLVVLVAHLVQAVLVAVHVPAVVLAAPAVHATDSVVHLARSHVHVVGASSTNCSRSSRSTRTATLRYPKARSSSNVVGRHRSLLRS